MRRIVHCAKGDERLGCILSSRVHRSHALPIPVFRVKTIQPSLNLRWFGHVRVIVCKCCGLSMAVPMANSPTPSLQHNYSNHCTATQYQCNLPYNLHLIEDCIVHGAPLFSLANRSMQNPKHDCVANINEKSACSCPASESNRKRNT